MKLDVQRLRQDHGIKPTEWHRTLLSYNQLVPKESGMEDEHRRQEQRAERKRRANNEQSDEEAVRFEELDAEAAGAVPQLAGGRGVRYAEWKERVVEEERKEEDDRRVKRQRLRDGGGEGNEDDECEYGDAEEEVEARKHRAPRQTRLSFPVAVVQKSDKRKAKAQSRRGGYTDVVVL